MKLKTTVITAILLPLLAFTQNSQASEQKKQRGNHLSHFINKFDSNKDSKVTNEEFTSSITKRFESMDVDKDGQVSADEFKNHTKSKHRQHKSKRKEKMDSNKDGVISKAEFVEAKLKRVEQKFAKLDKDNDGFLSDEEAAKQGRKFKKSKHYFKRIDANQDGVISLDENKTSSNNLFKKLDSNKDQVITQEEIHSMVERHKTK